MLSREDVESFLRISGLDFEEVDAGMWVVRPEESEAAGAEPAVVVSHVPPVLLVRADIRAVPEEEEGRLRLYERLLNLNAVDLVHGAYGVEDGRVILSDTLELENLDFSEFRASLESLTLAVTSHWQQLTTD